MKPFTLILIFLIILSCGQKSFKKLNKHVLSQKIDTLVSGDYILYFENGDSFEKSDNYGDLNTRIELTKTIDNSHRSAFKIQEYLSEKYSKYFYTNDSTLILKLSNGNIVPFPYWDNLKDEGYNFEHYFENIDYYLLRVQYSEGNSWMLVNRKNGFKTYILGEPYISPDNKKLITIDCDLIANYNFTGIGLYSISKDSLKKEFLRETKWCPIDIKWISKNQFLLKREILNFDTITYNENSEIEYKLVTIKNKTSQ
jgi:hypothetical protein